MSKGSNRRPAAIAQDDYRANFDAIDWGTKPEVIEQVGRVVSVENLHLFMAAPEDMRSSQMQAMMEDFVSHMQAARQAEREAKARAIAELLDGDG